VLCRRRPHYAAMVIFDEGKSLQNPWSSSRRKLRSPDGRAQPVYEPEISLIFPHHPPSYCARVIAALVSEQVRIYVRMALTFANTTAISYGQRAGQGFWISALCKTNSVRKSQKITSTLVPFISSLFSFLFPSPSKFIIQPCSQNSRTPPCTSRTIPIHNNGTLITIFRIYP